MNATPPVIDTVAWLVSEDRVLTDGDGALNRVAHGIDAPPGDVTALVDARRPTATSIRSPK